jgi:hypothetical protein
LPFDRSGAELKKVVLNVQFEEIRDEALKALNSLWALGDLYRKLRKTTRLKIWKWQGANIDAEQGSYPAETKPSRR